MRKNLFLLPALLLVASAMFVSSCTKDCKFKQEDYKGSYSVDEDCSMSAPALYTVTVVLGAGETDVKLGNVWNNFLAPVNATIDCETITIPRQEPDNDQFFVEGSGYIEKNNGVTTITLSYTVTDESVTPFDVDNCTSTVLIKH